MRHYEHTADVNGQKVGYSLFQKYGKWQVRFTVDRQIVKRSTGEQNESQAIEKAKELIRAEIAPTEKNERLEWTEAIQATKETMMALNLKESSVKEVVYTIGQVKHLAKSPLELTTEKAKNWYRTYQKSGVSVTTQRGILKKLSSIWSKYFIKHLRTATVNPWKEIELPKKPKLKIRTLKQNELESFFEWLEKFDWLPKTFFKIKALSGCRLFDLCQAETIHLQGNVLKLIHTKTNEAREITLTPELVETLNEQKGEKYLFQSYSKDFEPHKLKYFILNLMNRFYKETGIDIRTHDFRKRFVSEAYKRGMKSEEIAVIVGMTHRNLLDSYLALDKSTIQKEGTAILSAVMLAGT